MSVQPMVVEGGKHTSKTAKPPRRVISPAVATSGGGPPDQGTPGPRAIRHDAARTQVREMAKTLLGVLKGAKMTDSLIGQVMGLIINWCRLRLAYQERSRSKGKGSSRYTIGGIDVDLNEIWPAGGPQGKRWLQVDQSAAMKQEWLALVDVLAQRQLLNERALLCTGYPSTVKTLAEAQTYPRGSLWMKGALGDRIGVQRPAMKGNPVTFGQVTRGAFIQPHVNFILDEKDQSKLVFLEDPNATSLRWVLASYGVGGSCAAVVTRYCLSGVYYDGTNYIVIAHAAPLDNGGRQAIPFIVTQWGITGRAIAHETSNDQVDLIDLRTQSRRSVKLTSDDLSKNFTMALHDKLASLVPPMEESFD